MVKLHKYVLQRKCRPKNFVFNDILFMAILAGNHTQRERESEALPLASENLINNQP